jgi:hypothetical protein
LILVQASDQFFQGVSLPNGWNGIDIPVLVVPQLTVDILT